MGVLALLHTACGSTVDGPPIDGSATDAPAQDAGPVVSPVPYDTCEAPLDVSRGGAFTLEMNEMHDDYEHTLGSLLCGGIVSFDACRDAVATFTLDEARDVDIVGDPGSDEVWVSLALKASCDDAASSVDTAFGYGAMPLRHRALPPGTYFLFMGTTPPMGSIVIGGPPPVDTGRLELSVTYGPPTAAPTNESCAAPLDVGTGGHFEGSFVDVPGDVGTCSTWQDPDLVYTFTTQARSNVHIALEASAILTVALTSSCGAGAPDTDCRLMNVPSQGPSNKERTFYDLPAGTYFLTLEDWTKHEPDFTLDIDIGPATPPPEGDTCSSPIPLEIATPFAGSLSSMQEDLYNFCGSGRRDAVHVFSISESSDVWITARSTGGDLYLMLASSCDEANAQLQCTGGVASASTYMGALAPGTYYVVVGSATVDRYELTVEAWPPNTITPDAVDGNESCVTAYDVPPEGGVFVGDTTTATDDLVTSMCYAYAGGRDVAFRWTTSSRRRVFATTAGSSFWAMLQLRESLSCSELACDGWSGGRSTTSPFASSGALDVDLPPGTYTFVVDGQNDRAYGPYRFELRTF